MKQWLPLCWSEGLVCACASVCVQHRRQQIYCSLCWFFFFFFLQTRQEECFTNCMFYHTMVETVWLPQRAHLCWLIHLIEPGTGTCCHLVAQMCTIPRSKKKDGPKMLLFSFQSRAQLERSNLPFGYSLNQPNNVTCLSRGSLFPTMPTHTFALFKKKKNNIFRQSSVLLKHAKDVRSRTHYGLKCSVRGPL